MAETRTTQTALARLSGIKQPSISQFLSGRIDFSDEQLDRALACLGYRLEITRSAVVVDLTRSERRSWRLHRELSARLTPAQLRLWHPLIDQNLARLREGVAGEPHTRNVATWQSLVDSGDITGLRRVLTGLDRKSVEMREVSPMGGLMSDEERVRILRAS
ncbi:transcriptional regulator [Mycobacterium sp. CBMA 213]|nr:helix-turn-helix domain-containing protein [Mycolicibacterium sp. CBMA 213]MUL61092.1 XRE family transcriptional regulator [Mycolicibacterium sp. CBMA 335]MUM03329.1 transcriptional regulator [Mycolicibacterium sp. CBMA 213]